jgi:1,4-alpha-glucan branching enzyme
MRLPEGSWGERGDHRVWVNDKTRWMWEVEYRAEERMLRMLRELPWRGDGAVRPILERAGRQLLLLQASDWPFVVHSGGAIDYGFQRFSGHATRFDRLAVIAHEVAAGRPLDPLQRIQIEEADAHDDVFPHINLGWWA